MQLNSTKKDSSGILSQKTDRYIGKLKITKKSRPQDMG